MVVVLQEREPTGPGAADAGVGRYDTQTDTSQVGPSQVEIQSTDRDEGKQPGEQDETTAA